MGAALPSQPFYGGPGARVTGCRHAPGWQNARVSSPAPDAPGTPTAPAPRPVLTKKQAQRANQPWIAMVLSVLATLAVALVVVALNPEPPAPARVDRVDVASAAATVPREEGALPALSPEIPEPWYANYARVQRLDGLDTWDVGWVVSDSVFAGLRQTAHADPTWKALRVGTTPAQETVEVDGIAWEYVVPEKSSERHFIADVEGSTIVLTTTGDRAVLEDLARAVAKETR